MGWTANRRDWLRLKRHKQGEVQDPVFDLEAERANPTDMAEVGILSEWLGRMPVSVDRLKADQTPL
jgi:hypothetical protein